MNDRRMWYLAAFVVGLSVVPARAQSWDTVDTHQLVGFYRTAHFRMQVERLFAGKDLRVPVAPPAHVPSPSDTVRHWLASLRPADPKRKEPEEEGFTVQTWRLVSKLQRGWFKKTFGSKWAYLGSNAFTSLDTTSTRELRARMQAFFGDPTRTLAEVDIRSNMRREEYIQFEYWFVLNDSIPLIVMDGNGPLDHGVVVASASRYRDTLFRMRQAFLGQIMREEKLAPYVDYYFDTRGQTWYRTGYDGARFFTEPIRAPNLVLGRPRLEEEP